MYLSPCFFLINFLLGPVSRSLIFDVSFNQAKKNFVPHSQHDFPTLANHGLRIFSTIRHLQPDLAIGSGPAKLVGFEILVWFTSIVYPPIGTDIGIWL